MRYLHNDETTEWATEHASEVDCEVDHVLSAHMLAAVARWPSTPVRRIDHAIDHYLDAVAQWPGGAVAADGTDAVERLRSL
eukprot:6182531-Pleurochrysis_carterae.AAC.1